MGFKTSKITIKINYRQTHLLCSSHDRSQSIIVSWMIEKKNTRHVHFTWLVSVVSFLSSHSLLNHTADSVVRRCQLVAGHDDCGPVEFVKPQEPASISTWPWPLPLGKAWKDLGDIGDWDRLTMKHRDTSCFDHAKYGFDLLKWGRPRVRGIWGKWW